jgi:hypothetical protein
MPMLIHSLSSAAGLRTATMFPFALIRGMLQRAARVVTADRSRAQAATRDSVN